MKKPSISLDSLDPFLEKIGKLTKVHKILICVGTLILLLGPTIYFVYIPKHDQIKQLTGEYNSLKSELQEAKQRASQLNKYKAEMKAVEDKFQIAKQALPESEEIPELLTSISHAGQDSGLEFILFKPEKEIIKGFYAEIPVSIKVLGNYYNIVMFYDKIAAMSRIVNIKDIKLDAVKNKKEPEKTDLNISCTAVTYKFVEAEPAEPAKKKK
ncbi:Putative pilus assembly protein PilO domain-containing protein [Desulfonema limicola]|uniref:Pilus assembly protein PilO domain-containing protein n=1 Tax=Desulfonema limicola TaxID=45656 RepID=A0A975BE40_9BACT|nr:type 4a pilus biogenesis protein PilO [Desulfonema limicola]QTA83648.1 Putative pilus assembly protein PilO domain-containing protein [Desulfonema limicola]